MWGRRGETDEEPSFICFCVPATSMAVIHGRCVMEACVCLCVSVSERAILRVFYVSRLPHVEGQTQSIEAINVA